MVAPYRVKLDVFEGPLDLLLHLVKKNEVAVADVPTAAITEQYLEYLQVMHELSLDVAGEYLVMAATLLLIKSRSLLPAAEEEPEEDDPRANLVRQLLDYQRYREAALELGERPLLNRDVFAREPLSPPAPGDAAATGAGSAPQVRATVWELIEAMRRVLERSRPEPVHQVELERVSVREQTRLLLDRLQAEPALAFEDLFSPQATRLEVITTFLALLELVRLGAVAATQDQRLGRIVIELAVEDVALISFDALEEYESRGVIEEEVDGASG